MRFGDLSMSHITPPSFPWGLAAGYSSLRRCSGRRVCWRCVKKGLHEVDMCFQTELLNFLGEQVCKQQGSAVLFGVEPEVEQHEDEFEGLTASGKSYYESSPTQDRRRWRMEKMAQQVLQRRDCRASAGALRAWQVSLRGSMSVSAEQIRQDNICRLQMSDGNRAQEPSHRSTFIELSPFYKSGRMFPEPRYLQLEEELFPSITLYKELLFHNPFTGFHCEIFERVAYDSLERSIDLTDCLDHVLKKEYGTHTDLEIMVFDPILHDYRLLAYFPIDANITLGEQFLQLDVIAFRLRPLPPLSDAFPDIQAAPKQSGHAVQGGDGEAASGWEKGKRRRSTIKQLLEVVQRWRVMWMDTGCKMTMAEGAAQMGISKRSLLFYIHNAKMGEKYHFDFHANLDRKIVELTAFVQEKAQLKKNEEAELISKLKTYYK